MYCEEELPLLNLYDMGRVSVQSICTTVAGCLMLQVGLALGNRPAKEGHIRRHVEVLRCTPTVTWIAHVYRDSTWAIAQGSVVGQLLIPSDRAVVR